ncbi:putative exported phage protein [Burkholderia aenigmatica]|uniref:Exported phage protein n=1 Tax=Burkholderia aenigmatica TaxID=2015348 RepID=A0ABY6XZC7_9BURK|nr:hypothetical protein [Burkholderia aenigmatica]VWC79224.1 putative exported phage protein [Burkholderia aenigmatica]
MFRTDQNTAVAALPVPAPPGSPGYFTGGNPATGQAATIVDADWLNMVQEELISILTAAGVAPGKATYNQVLAALQILFASASGNPNALFKVKTASLGDSSNNAASTAYVWGALGNYGSFFPFSAASQQLTASQSGDLIYFFGTNTGVVTLPQGASLQGPSARFVIYNGSLANLTVSAFAGDVWQNWARASEVIGPGDSIEVVWSNGQYFNVVGGSAALKRSSLFASSLFASPSAASGYQQLPSGLIIQWGSVTTSASNDVGVTFPIAFPNNARAVTLGNVTGSGGFFNGFNALTLSGFQAASWVNNTTRGSTVVNWMAIGN